MADQPSTVCFECGLEIGDPPRLNHTAEGDVCPSCRDRLYQALPSILPHMPWKGAVEAEGDAAQASEWDAVEDGEEAEEANEEHLATAEAPLENAGPRPLPGPGHVSGTPETGGPDFDQPA